jgi:hypothetical protein
MRYASLITSTACGALILAAALGPVSCTYDKASPVGQCDTLIPSYTDTIAEIIVKYCSDSNHGDCHDGTGTQDQPDYTTFAGVQEQAQSGAITEFVFEKGEMPPEFDTQGPKFLEPGDAELLRCWIANGAPDN